MLNIPISGDIISYADDTALLFYGDKWSDIVKNSELGLYKIKCWLDKNILSLNYTKTKFITFSGNQSSQPDINHITFHSHCDMVNCNCNVKIDNTVEIKYLGIIINNTLNWSSHINHLASKLRKFVYMFYKFRDVLPLNILKMTYKALVESVISYGIIIWGGTYNTHVQPLLITQKYILKVMLSKRRMYPTDLLFAESKVYDVRLLYVYSVAKYMYRRPSLRQYIGHTHNTRHVFHDSLKIPKA